MVARARTLLVKSTSPSGIILMRPATVLVTAISGVVSGTRKRARRSRIPIGMRVREIYLTMLFTRLKSLESAVLMVRASDSSLLMKLLAPTEVAVA